MLKKLFANIKKIDFVALAIYLFVALATINFANSFTVTAIIGIALSVFLTVYISLRNKKTAVDYAPIFISLLPLIDFALFFMFSKFNNDPDAAFSVFERLLLVVSIVFIPLIGCLSNQIPSFNIKTLLKVFFAALGIWMFINLLITLFKYGPFYNFIYTDKYFFDYGKIGKMPIGETTFMLLGFNAVCVSGEYFSLFSLLLSSSIIGAFFKSDKQTRILFLATGLIGIICVVFTANIYTLIPICLILLSFIFLIVVPKLPIIGQKIVKYVLYIFGAFIFILLVIFILNTLGTVPILQEFIGSNALLDKLFNSNVYSIKYQNIIVSLAKNDSLFGFTGYLAGDDSLVMSGSWIFDLLLIGGLIAEILFIIFISVFIFRYVKYFKSSNDETCVKLIILGVLFVFFGFTLVSYNSMPYYFSNTYLPIFYFPMFLCILFIYGYIGKKEKIKNEK